MMFDLLALTSCPWDYVQEMVMESERSLYDREIIRAEHAGLGFGEAMHGD